MVPEKINCISAFWNELKMSVFSRLLGVVNEKAMVEVFKNSDGDFSGEFCINAGIMKCPFVCDVHE